MAQLAQKMDFYYQKIGRISVWVIRQAKTELKWVWFSVFGQKQKTRYAFLEFVTIIIHDHHQLGRCAVLVLLIFLRYEI